MPELDMDRQEPRLEDQARLGRLARVLARLFAAQSVPREFCQAALEAIGDVVRAKRSHVVMFEEDASEATVLATRGHDGAPLSADELGLSRSFLREVATGGATVLVTDARNSHLSGETSVIALDMRSVLAAPLTWDGRVHGAIFLENATLADAFTRDHAVLLEAVAELLAPYIQAGGRLVRADEDRDRLQAALDGSVHFRDIIGTSRAIRRLVALIERLKDSDAPILVEGESGTGKELVARALHSSGRRAKGPLVSVNCAAIPETLMESELLGHERGAFTGATDRRIGRFEQAHGGTLFLDEVGELRADVQAKLLRVVQEQVFERVGGSQVVKVDVRLVAATNRNLQDLVTQGRFREDLFYRLHVVPLRVPPLRERPEDIPLLVEHFLGLFNKSSGRSVRFEPAVMAALQAHPFPGNVRELKNLVQRLVALAATDLVTLADLPETHAGEQRLSLDKDPFRRFLRQVPTTNEELKVARTEMQQVYDRYLAQLEARFLEGVLERAGGNVSEAARQCGMNRTLFHRKLKESRREP